MIKYFLTITTFFLFININSIIAQDCGDHQAETTSTIKELDDFHEIIFPIWHEAYPNKDYAALRKYKEEVNTLAGKIFAVKLPGILRDKETKWNEGIEQMKAAVEDYNLSCDGNDDEKLLKSAEELHSRYEMLVRVIRPLNKEVDEFHKVLYVVYHYYGPEKDYKKIGGVVGDLLKKAQAIEKVKLSKRLEAKQNDYVKAAKELISSVKDLKTKLNKKNKKDVDGAIEVMHSKYQAIENIFN